MLDIVGAHGAVNLIRRGGICIVQVRIDVFLDVSEDIIQGVVTLWLLLFGEKESLREFLGGRSVIGKLAEDLDDDAAVRRLQAIDAREHRRTINKPERLNLVMYRLSRCQQ
jgi:hypothetical protein